VVRTLSNTITFLRGKDKVHMTVVPEKVRKLERGCVVTLFEEHCGSFFCDVTTQ